MNEIDDKILSQKEKAMQFLKKSRDIENINIPDECLSELYDLLDISLIDQSLNIQKEITEIIEKYSAKQWKFKLLNCIIGYLSKAAKK